MKVPPIRPSGLWGAVHEAPAADPRPPGERAAALRERWAVLGQAHLPGGGGCACGFGAGALEPREFDDLVIGYLRQKYRDAGRASLAARLDGRAALDALLGDVGAGALPKDEAAVLLADLERAIGSFEDLHRRS